MTLRSVEETARDTLEWIEEEATPDDRDDIPELLASRLNPNEVSPPVWFNADTEDRLLQAWKAR